MIFFYVDLILLTLLSSFVSAKGFLVALGSSELSRNCSSLLSAHLVCSWIPFLALTDLPAIM